MSVELTTADDGLRLLILDYRHIEHVTEETEGCKVYMTTTKGAWFNVTESYDTVSARITDARNFHP